MSLKNKAIKWLLYILMGVLLGLEIAILSLYLTTPIVYLVSCIVSTAKGINMTVIGMLKYVLYASAIVFIILTVYVLRSMRKKKGTDKTLKVDPNVIQ